jgi:hypothetical protein
MTISHLSPLELAAILESGQEVAVLDLREEGAMTLGRLL